MTALPGPSFEAAIRPHTGDIVGVRPTSRGNSSASTVLVDGAHGSFFVKGVPNRPGGRRDSLVREGLINRFVSAFSPSVLWQAETDEWLALGFEVIDARPSDFTPGSPDLPTIIETLTRIADLPLPGIAQGWTETRWDRFAADPAHVESFRGGTLLFTDINPANLLVGDGRMWAVDWSWPTRGAGFIDPACLVLQLVAAGHTAEAAESWAARCPAWTAADPRAIDAFAAATLNMYTSRAERYPDEDWLKVMATAAQGWAAHRGVAVRPHR
ncbi:protein kinase [Actinomadura miaoliensis]|uniref:Protein kinase n=1 Tax=Actinomadura miaoliensis TaxID=430685 RepID=A0ABP7X3U1_9ACTN